MKKTYWIAIAAVLTFVCVLGIPIIFSTVTGVPYWYLFPLRELSIVSPGRVMSVKVNPTVPTTLGEIITVTVLDAANNTPIEQATVKVMKDSVDFTNVTTNAKGIATFEYPGATTIIYVSKDGYNDAPAEVIPKIPDSWVTIQNYQYVTWGITLLASWTPVIYLSLKPKEEQQHKIPKRR
jgi:hypothetical protein